MKRITEYNNITNIAENDVLPIVDVSDTSQASTGSTKKGTIEKIADYLKDRAETLTNKILTTARLNTPKINEDVTVTATSTELNKLDGIAGDIVGTTDTQEISNKTSSKLYFPGATTKTSNFSHYHWSGDIDYGESPTVLSIICNSEYNCVTVDMLVSARDKNGANVFSAKYLISLREYNNLSNVQRYAVYNGGLAEPTIQAHIDENNQYRIDIQNNDSPTGNLMYTSVYCTVLESGD